MFDFLRRRTPADAEPVPPSAEAAPSVETVEVDGRLVALSDITSCFSPECPLRCEEGMLKRGVPAPRGVKGPIYVREICVCAARAWRAKQRASETVVIPAEPKPAPPPRVEPPASERTKRQVAALDAEIEAENRREQDIVGRYAEAEASIRAELARIDMRRDASRLEMRVVGLRLANARQRLADAMAALEHARVVTAEAETDAAALTARMDEQDAARERVAGELANVGSPDRRLLDAIRKRRGKLQRRRDIAAARLPRDEAGRAAGEVRGAV